VTVWRGDNHFAMRDVEAVRQTDQTASGLARLGSDYFVDRRVVLHWSECRRHPEGPGSCDLAV
jgi:hypothetical protein